MKVQFMDSQGFGVEQLKLYIDIISLFSNSIWITNYFDDLSLINPNNKPTSFTVKYKS